MYTYFIAYTVRRQDSTIFNTNCVMNTNELIRTEERIREIEQNLKRKDGYYYEIVRITNIVKLV